MNTHSSGNAGYGGLDLFRLPAALLVIAIHTSPLSSFHQGADFFLTRILARISVPFFFMVTGHFVVSRFFTEPDSSGRVLKNCLKKYLLLYAGASLLYLPAGIYAGHYKGLLPGDILRMLFFDGTFYHLWYFPACLLGICLLYLFSRFLSLDSALALSLLLYIPGLLGDSYYGLTLGLPFLETFYGKLFSLFSYTRNGLFFAPLFLCLGAWCAINSGKRPSPAGRWLKPCGLALCFLLMIAEAFLLRGLSWQRHDSMYLLLPPVMLFLYGTLLQLPIPAPGCGRLLRRTALWVYLLHPGVIIGVRGFAKPLHLTGLLVDNSLVHFLAVAGISLCVSLGLARLQLRLLHRRYSAARKPSPNLSGSAVSLQNLSCPSGSLHGISCGRAWIELDRQALAKNVAFLTSLLPKGCQLMPAVKADAYGHGARLIAAELNRLGIHVFCVACLSEGISLREAGVQGDILILGYTAPEDFPLLARCHLSQTIVDFPYARQLAASGLRLSVHLAVDTGMHRLGIRCKNSEEILSIFKMKNLSIEGMFTHLSASDSAEPEKTAFTESQIQAFYNVVSMLQEQGIDCPKLHLLSSYGLLNYPRAATDYVRAGIALYGVPSALSDSPHFPGELSPVLSLKALVTSVRTLYAGESAGYGPAFTASENMRIATLSIGYGDGYPRELSCGRGYVLLHGCKAPVLGRICMDQTLIDVSNIPQTQAGDTATLIGACGSCEITVQELAAQCGTISNELLSRLGPRLKRIWKNEN